MSETTAAIVPVVMIWSFDEGYHYVGPFGSVPEANEWGIEHEDDHGPEWHSELVDPALPLEVRAPDGVAELPADDPDRVPGCDEFEDPFSDTEGAAFHLLMTSGKPLHLVGPFEDHRTAFLWGRMNERRGGDIGWQVVWLEEPSARVRLVQPASNSRGRRVLARKRDQHRADAMLIADFRRDEIVGVNAPAPTQTIINGDCLEELRAMPAASVDAAVFSPPYNLKKRYNVHNDDMPEAVYLAWQDEVARELRRVMKPFGHVFLNVGWNSRRQWRSNDVAMAYRPFFVLQNQIAWIKSVALDASTLPDEALRSEMHERTFGHFTPIGSSTYLNPCWEIIWHFTPTGRSPIDREAIGVPYVFKDQPARFGHNRELHCRGNVWHKPYKTTQSRDDRFNHPSPYPVDLALMCLKLAKLGPDALVLDPFAGIGSTLLAAQELGLRAIGIEIDPAYCAAAEERLLAGRCRSTIPTTP